tara:strand:+ start:204 stop:485 length:282 start_codon:yes stop_codon:yes gene_type:complete
MLAENLQIDSQVNSIVSAIFPYNGKNLTFVSISSHNHLIPDSAPVGVWMTGGQSQVVLVDEDYIKYEAYVYYYNKHEGPRMFILQTLELKEKE